MRVTRLAHVPGIGVDRVGDAADALDDPEILRLENLDVDIRPPRVAVEATAAALEDDDANSYLPFQGHLSLREAACAWVGARDGVAYDARTQCVSVAGGLNGILNVLLATVEPGQEVVLTDPIYAGLVNRVRLAGGVPRFVPARATAEGWHVDPDELAAAVGPGTAAVITMSPSMPTGGVMGPAHWTALAEGTGGHRPWIIHDTAMDRLRFGGPVDGGPAAVVALRDRTITVGSASKELRMIGWRVGWVVGPAEVMADVALVGMANVVCQVGIAQQAVAAALSAPDAEADVRAFTDVLEARARTILQELEGYPCVRPHGGWSLLIDTRPLGLTPAEASDRLMRLGKVAATPMDGWGPSGEHHLRLVFANEPVERLADLRARFDAALG